MTIDWDSFTPLGAALGGVMIGGAATMLLLFLGRIAGISGIVGGLLRRTGRDEASWRLAFVLGLVLAPTLYRLLGDLPVSRIEAGWPALVVAGLLVGFGARVGSGCTSGHGVCGIARLSRRSIVATATFMGSGLLTVFLVRHLFS